MNKDIFDIQMFADGGAAGAGAAGAAAGTSEGTGAENNSHAAGGNNRAKKSLENVVYGKSQQQNQSDAGAGKNNSSERSSFEDLIKGDYKEDYEKHFQKEFQKVFNERHAKQQQETQKMRKDMEDIRAVTDMLAAKYGVDGSDMKALVKAIEADDAYYEQEANEKGISVEQLKSLRKMEQENATLRRKMQETMQQEQAQRNIAEWMRQSEEVKKTYPNFDFNKESENRDFRDLIIKGIPVQTAYEILHKDEIMGGAMQYTAQTVAQKISQNIQSRAERPTENGMSSNNGIVTKTDVHKLTKADRQEIARRVARGERITF